MLLIFIIHLSCQLSASFRPQIFMLRPMSVERSKEKGKEDNNGAIEFLSIKVKVLLLDYRGNKEQISSNCRIYYRNLHFSFVFVLF